MNLLLQFCRNFLFPEVKENNFINFLVRRNNNILKTNWRLALKSIEAPYKNGREVDWAEMLRGGESGMIESTQTEIKVRLFLDFFFRIF